VIELPRYGFEPPLGESIESSALRVSNNSSNPACISASANGTAATARRLIRRIMGGHRTMDEKPVNIALNR
jgi:hypothetical protein